MAEPVTDPEPTKLYVLPVVKYASPQPEDQNLPVGWMPVFRTQQAAQSYAGSDQTPFEFVPQRILRTN